MNWEWQIRMVLSKTSGAEHKTEIFQFHTFDAAVKMYDLICRVLNTVFEWQDGGKNK